MLREVFKELGIQESAADIYNVLLKHGPLSAIELSNKLKLSRMGVYNLAKELIAQELVVKRGNSFFAENPQILRKKIVSRERYIREQRETVEQLVSDYSSVRIKTYTGEAGLISLNKDLGRQKVDKAYIVFNGDFMPNFLISRRNSKKFMNNKVVVFSNKAIPHNYHGPLTLSHQQGGFSSLIVMGDKVAIFSMPEKSDSHGLLIEDSGLAAFFIDLIDNINQ